MYHYTGCGLDNVYLVNGYTEESGAHGTGVSIHDLDGLHEAIGRDLANKSGPLAPTEIRFFRHELDLSQGMLGQLLDVKDQTIANWEKGNSPAPRTADVAIRNLYMESLGDNHVSGILTKLSQLDREIVECQLLIERKEAEEAWGVTEKCA